MAEMIRRATEDALGMTLPEETEVRMPWRGKERLYGSSRILDGDTRAANEFMRWHQLDYGVRVRWYVEGDTEYGALSWVVEELGAGHIELINLRGQVAQRRVLAFRDNLCADLKKGTFSLISIDGDRPDFLRAVIKAAEADEICGEFFVSKPDFEFHNFTLPELEEVLWSVASEGGATPRNRERLHRAIANAKSGDQLLHQAKSAVGELPHF
jgi:hypothetical protein